MRNYPAIWLTVACVPFTFTHLAAQEKPEESDKKESPSIHEVTAKPFKSSVELSAIFESTRLTEVVVAPEEWKTLTVKKVVPNGKKVNKGDSILSFETEDLEEKIEELEAGRRAAKLTLQQTADSYRHLEQSTPLDLDTAEKTRAEAEEALAYFEKVQLEQSRESARQSLQNAEFSLEYSQEELNQLEKMYKEDNLTEETEEIILKRTRRSVELAKRSLERTRLTTKRTLKVELPRRHQSLKAAAKKAVLEHELGRVSLPRALELKKLELDKAKEMHKKSEETLSLLKMDLKKLTVKAPVDGNVFYGIYVDGKWATAAAVAKKLIPGGVVSPKERIFTIADADALRLRAAVPENQLGLLRKGQEGEAVPVAFPGERLTARITSLSFLPTPSGGYAAEISFEPNLNKLKPGMHAKVTFTAFERQKVITIPNKAVRQDEKGPYVTLVKEDGVDERHVVSLGFTDGKVTVVKKGLKPGDNVRVD